ncbi:hypothetical protein D3C80_2042010 [compost metagenome]
MVIQLVVAHSLPLSDSQLVLLFFSKSDLRAQVKNEGERRWHQTAAAAVADENHGQERHHLVV